MKTDREVLEQAIELIENPEHWTQGALARDVTGQHVDPLAPTAVTWCARGALWRASGRHHQENTQQIGRLIAHIMGGGIMGGRNGIIGFNDNSLHGDVVLAMKRALDKV